MATRHEPWLAWAAPAAAALSALLLYFGSGLHPLWPLTWLAPLPVLYAATRLPAGRAFAFTFLAWLLGGLNLWTYLRWTVHVPLPVCLLVTVGPPLLFASAVLLFRGLARRGRAGWAAVSLPAAWVMGEALNAAFSPHGTFGSLAYTQMNVLPLIQIAAVTGICGISFLLLLAPATAAAMLAPGVDRRQRWRLGGAVAGVFALALGYGVARLHDTPAGGTTIVAGLAASDLPQYQWPHKEAVQTRLLHEYATVAGQMPPATVVLLPEKILPAPPSMLVTMDATLGPAARQSNTTLVAGVLNRPAGQERGWNQARVYSPEGSLEATYEKHHLIPGAESDEQPGHSITLLNEPSGRWGVEICKDMDFPALSRRYGEARVGLLLAPAWDFVRDGWLHDRMAVLRGVESGFSIVRAARDGLLTVSDDRGRILAQASSRSAPFTRLTVRVPVRHDTTLYVLWGNWFAWLDAAIFLAALAVLATSKKNHAGVVPPG